ncbi:MAG: hypothetical protein A3D92_15985 [Bacteroidetes bacterium RIFCSPHIGHO2_02_FULL_44_7]|nr:MAG: hypothetical protein A3D92_15985 [Bacteroidetes bacterium RIFCSPHIGHO2_02_FULL_44_7]
MKNRQLTQSERGQLFEPLFGKVKKLLENASRGDKELLWALTRKLRKEVMYLERGKPGTRRRLKKYKREEQNGKCAVCKRKLPHRGAVLDRLFAMRGYTKENTRLLCPRCDARIQRQRHFR